MTPKQWLVDTAIIARNLKDVEWPLRHLRSGALQSRPDGKRFLVLPADPADPTGSIGEVAMLSGLMRSLKVQHPSATFTLIGTRVGQIEIPHVGKVDVEPAWIGHAGSKAFDQLVRQHHAFLGLGADVMDGNYGAALVCRFAGYCNHAAGLGIPTTILGFSFNNRPRRPALYALSRLNPAVRVNVRGQTSLDRFSRTVGIPADLCADLAFLMPPAPEADPAVENWIAQMRSAGRLPVGVNINAHAFGTLSARAGIDAVVDSLARRLLVPGQQHQLAFLLIPHDLKKSAGDTTLLPSLDVALRSLGFPHVQYAAMADPDRIKRATGLLDLVVTARMHLAIASVGMGTPILSITYQDKFEDLIQHFGLPVEDMIRPEQCLTDELSGRISRAIARRNDAHENIVRRLPHVTELARRNLLISQ